MRTDPEPLALLREPFIEQTLVLLFVLGVGLLLGFMIGAGLSSPWATGWLGTS